VDRADTELTVAASYHGDDPQIPVQLVFEMVTADWSRVARAFVRSLHAYQTVHRLRAQRLERVAHTAVTVAPVVVVDHEPAVPVAPVTAGPAPSILEAPRKLPITRRQFEIAELIARGLSNDEIAARLVLTPGTVGNHVGHILRRLGARNRAQIAAWVTRMAAASRDG